MMIRIKKLELNNAILATLTVKFIGVIREIFLFILTVSFPNTVNIYFIASQSGIGFGERLIVRFFYVIISCLIFVYQKPIDIFIFALIAVPFYFWPKILFKANMAEGFASVIYLSLLFNVLSILEISLKLKYQIELFDNYGGLPIFSLWITVVYGLLKLGIGDPPKMMNTLNWIICILVFFRLTMLLGWVKLGVDGFVIMIILRIFEIIIPQFSNYQRIFKSK